MGELEGFVEQLLPFFHPFPSIALLPVGLLRRLGEVLVFNDLADLVTAFGRTSILCKKIDRLNLESNCIGVGIFEPANTCHGRFGL